MARARHLRVHAWVIGACAARFQLVVALVALCTLFGLANAARAGDDVVSPSFTVGAWQVDTAAASGPTFALAVDLNDQDCAVYILDLARSKASAHGSVPGNDGNGCNSGDGATSVTAEWLRSDRLVAMVLDTPSPHSATWSLWQESTARGRFAADGNEWGWQDSEQPYETGCAYAGAAGGGVIAIAPEPNGSAVGNLSPAPVCPGHGHTVIALTGAGGRRSRVILSGLYAPLATNRTELLLAALNRDGVRTGGLRVITLAGMMIGSPTILPAAVRSATNAWLTQEGPVIENSWGVFAAHWHIGGVVAATVAAGRLFYIKNTTVRERLLSDGTDRPLFGVTGTLLQNGAGLAAGSFGLGVALVNADGSTVSVYRLPWSLVKSTLPA